MSMYSITYIHAGRLTAIASPSQKAALRTFHALRCKAGLNARLWLNSKGCKPQLIF